MRICIKESEIFEQFAVHLTVQIIMISTVISSALAFALLVAPAQAQFDCTACHPSELILDATKPQAAMFCKAALSCALTGAHLVPTG